MRRSPTAVSVSDGFVDPEQRSALLKEITAYREGHVLPYIEREESDRPLRYQVIDGEAVALELPGVVRLYEQVKQAVGTTFGDELVPLPNARVRVNVNVTPPGGSYRWHYDRNPVTAVAYLNPVAGGDIEVYANYRIDLGPWRHTAAQRWADRLLRTPFAVRRWGQSRYQRITPAAGRLVTMAADRCLHSVCPVEGTDDRIAVVMAYDLGGANTGNRGSLDSYIYSDVNVRSGDPNYSR